MAAQKMSTDRGGPQVEFRTIRIAEPWEAYVIPVSGFPVPSAELGAIRDIVGKFSTTARKEWSLVSEVAIQVMEVHRGDGPERIVKHGREWIPATGLGVWPDRDPPRLWTQEDFIELGMNEALPPLMYQLLRVSTTPDARDGARDVMLGIGAIVEILVLDPIQSFLDRARSVLLAPITDAAFTCFPFYHPLFDAKSLRSASRADLDRWSCGAVVYIRESPEDKGILIASSRPLQPVLTKLGALPGSGPGAAWLVPA